jgi:DNA-binding MarR family transcriptional regulator
VKTKSDLVDEINGLIGAVGDKFDAEEGDPERDYMAAHCPNRLEAIARRLPTLSMHLLAHIAEGPVSVLGLAARADQLKGTVSKHVQRLVEAGLVDRTPIPGNRKEVTLSLTADGKLVADVHQRMHDEMKRGGRRIPVALPQRRVVRADQDAPRLLVRRESRSADRATTGITRRLSRS